ncbi:MAG: hypothetical protein KDK30_16050, partial [Leptospiraceae bacterium]|nr:hypothetical protein [Leptospiraceae bacterium]
PELRPETMTLLSDPAAVRARFPAPGRTSDEIDLERTVYFAPLVCYESLFPEYVRAFFIQRQRPVPALIINTSNDVWFGNFIEVYQHNAGARLRAIEMGRYMVRANQSGLSTIFDPLGRAVVPPLQPGERDVRAAAVPLRTEVTAYMRHGNFSVFLFTGIVILLMVIGLCYPSLRRPPVA